MSFLEVLKYPDPFLKAVAEPVREVDDEVRTLLDDMVYTMYADKGIGLAAVQVGVARRVIVIDIPGEDEDEPRGSSLIELINPVIVARDGEIRFEEGCLSVPGVNAYVRRANHVIVEGLDRDGNPKTVEGYDILAVCLQHEIDHLEGILFIERLSFLKRDMIKRKYRKLQEEEANA